MKLAALAPGLLLCAAIALAAVLAGQGEARLFGRAWLEPLVLAILIGAMARTVWTPGARWRPGVGFAARRVLEVAVVLLGFTVTAPAILAVGPALIGAVFALVAAALAVGYAIGRWMGLAKRTALLVACGNAVCGNSAIAAVAPTIGAEPDEVAASIAFTAVLGVIVVLLLPLLQPLLGLSALQYGAVAGLTVYAVPQVVAAAAPAGASAVQLATLVKLVRVLALGPVAATLAVLTRGWRSGEVKARLKLDDLVPWFVAGFLLAVGVRSAGWLPEVAIGAAEVGSRALTLVAMAALGLGVDVRAVSRSGPRVIAAGTLGLLVMVAFAVVLVHVLRL
jgi:uncharacterized integral membrane protein (TIGR00698 family)